MARIMGVQLKRVQCNEDGSMDPEALISQISIDRENGLIPFTVYAHKFYIHANVFPTEFNDFVVNVQNILIIN